MTERPRPDDREQPHAPREPMPDAKQDAKQDAARAARDEAARDLRESDRVTEADEESFPASDPPAWSPSHAGSPVEKPGDEAGG